MCVRLIVMRNTNCNQKRKMTLQTQVFNDATLSANGVPAYYFG